MRPIVFFLAEMGIYAFSRSMAIFAGAMKNAGQSAFLTHCTGEFRRCSFMAALKLPPSESLKKKKMLCAECNRYARLLSSRYSVPLLSFRDFWTHDEDVAVHALFEENRSHPLDIMWQGVPVGKIAYRSIVLATKDNSPFFSGEREDLFFQEAYTAIQSASITQKIIGEVEPAAFAFGQNYCPEIASRVVCRKNGIKISHHMGTILNGHDFGRIIVHSRPFSQILKDLPRQWREYRDIPLSPDKVRSCWDDVYCRNYLSGNSHIYSPRKSGDLEAIRDKFSLDPKRKTLIIYTSSPDERDALQVSADVDGVTLEMSDIFEDQVIWIQSVCSYVAANENLQLVVRIHPRLGKDNRSGIAHAHLQALESVFSELPARCHIAWPQDPVSSYDLAELADVVLVSWSTMGKELARIGVPVIATVRHFHYPDGEEFIRVPASKDEYFSCIADALNKKTTVDMLAKAIRFHYFTSELPALDLRESMGSEIPDILFDATVSLNDDVSQRLCGLFLEKSELLDDNLHQFKATARALPGEEIQEICKEVANYIDCSFFPPERDIPAIANGRAGVCKSYIKKLLPQSLVSTIRNCIWAYKARSITPVAVERKEIFSRSVLKFRFIPESYSLEQCQERTSKDPLLCLIGYENNVVYYIKNGIVKKRCSLAILRLVHLLEQNCLTFFEPISEKDRV